MPNNKIAIAITITITIIVVVLLVIFGSIFYFSKKENKVEKINDIISEEIIIPENQDKSESDVKEKTENETWLRQAGAEEKIPDKFLIDVPFTSQAPFAKWDELHEESCEEASIVMVKYFLDKKNLSTQIAEKEIQDLVKFQIKKYGDYKDSNAEQTARLYSDFYGQPEDDLKMKVIYNFERNDLKRYLARGYPIIIPAAGRLLGNPNFTAPGPLYHNLVLIGYEGDTIIANDPGTKRGHGYKYDIDVLYKAIHDFTGKKSDIEKGEKAMIVLE